MTATVFLGLGSNLDPHTNLRRAARAIATSAPVRAVSPVYRSAPVGMDGGDFLNAAVAVGWRCELPALASLKHRLAAVEEALGRAPGSSWAPRTIDIDILLADGLTGLYGRRPWRLPHPDIGRHAHVAVPLADIAGSRCCAGRELTEIAAELRERCAPLTQLTPSPLEASRVD